MGRIRANGGKSTRDEHWYFTQSTLAAVRIGDIKFQLLTQPSGWLGPQVTPGWPKMTNLRLDPFERLGFEPGQSWRSFEHYYGRQFWRFVMMQEQVGELAKTAIAYPPMQPGASFNLDAVKKQIAASQAAHAQ